MHFRPATESDASAIAAIHTRSWQLHYRRALPDQYLDHEAAAERRRFWERRLVTDASKLHIMVAHEGPELIGFCCLETDIHPNDGYYLDNLHVIPEAKGQGIGKALMQKCAALLQQEGPAPNERIYLWVLTGNTDAISFYDHLGANRGRREVHALAGHEVKVLLMWWPLSTMAGWNQL